jgi:hypothetical protein
MLELSTRPSDLAASGSHWGKEKLVWLELQAGSLRGQGSVKVSVKPAGPHQLAFNLLSPNIQSILLGRARRL